jgi:Tol biopolymer transport system component
MKPSWGEEEFRRALRDAADSTHVRSTATDLARRESRRRRRSAWGRGSAALAGAVAVFLVVYSLRPGREAPPILSITDLGDGVEAVTEASLAPAPDKPVPARQTPRVAIGRQLAGSVASSISSDGRIVAFSSDDPHLVNGDTNAGVDIFVRDTSSGKTIRVSVSSSGTQANGSGREPRVSGDGRFVVFSSDATNLVPDDTNKAKDVFVRDLVSGETTRVSISSSGAQLDGASDMPTISDDGSTVAFRSSATDATEGDSNEYADIFVREVGSGSTTLASAPADGEANGPSRRPFLSGDGRFLAFASAATNLVADDSNGVFDVFVRDLGSGSITRESIGEDGRPMAMESAWPALSRDGSVLGFLALVSGPEICRDDPGGPRPCRMTFVRDRMAGTTVMVSRTTDGSPTNGDSFSVAVSPDGGSIAFSSTATDIGGSASNGKRQVFLYRRADRSLTLVSVGTDGKPASGDSGGPAVAEDGRVVSFQSLAADIVRKDRNGRADIFIRSVGSKVTRLISTVV